MVYQRFSLWVERFSEENFLWGKKNSHCKENNIIQLEKKQDKNSEKIINKSYNYLPEKIEEQSL